MTHRLALRAAVLATWIAAAGCDSKPEPPEAAWNVILLTIDALRADAVSYAGYPDDTTPELDRLANSSTVFRTAIASHLGTPPSMSSLMTGRYPSFEGVERWHRPTHHGFSDLNSPDEKEGLTENVLTLAEILSASGFRTAGFCTNANLTDSTRFHQGFDEWDQFGDYYQQFTKTRDHPLKYSYPTADVVIDKVVSWLDRAGDRPFFLWLHIMEPHSPYLPPPPLNRFFDRDYTTATDLEINEALYRLLIEQYPGTPPREYASYQDLGLTKQELMEHARGLYDGDIRFGDRELGRFLRALGERSLWDRTLLMVTADHGEEFLDHGHVTHHLLEAGPEELIRVPLLIRMPQDAAGVDQVSPTAFDAGRAHRIVDAVVRLVDLAPTVLDFLDLGAAAAGMDGTSLRPLLEGRSMPPLTAFMSGVDFGIARDARWKYRLERQQPGAPVGRELLFDIVADPLEQHDLAAEHPEVFESLRGRYREFARHLAERSRTGALSGEAPEIDPELRRRLEALGYTGD